MCECSFALVTIFLPGCRQISQRPQKHLFNCLFFVCNAISHKRAECAQILFTKEEGCDDLGHKDTCNLNKSICKRNDLTNVIMGCKFCENKSEHLEYIKKQIRPTVVVPPGRGEVSHNHKAQRHLQFKQNICNRNNMTVVTRLLFCVPALSDSPLLINRGKRKQAPTKFANVEKNHTTKARARIL